MPSIRLTAETIATKGPVLVVGAGLIGTSIALSLQGRGVPVWLSDPSPVSLALATDMGAGIPLAAVPLGEQNPRLVVVAAPPDVAGEIVVENLVRYPTAVVTDVASVKEAVIADIRTMTTTLDPTNSQLSRYVGSHPMGGRATAGASSAHADLFYGRPWVLVPTEKSDPAALLIVRDLAVDLGAVPLELEAKEHDQAVAMVSHVPQLVSSLLAARLTEASPQTLALAGQGLRDTTRIAASDPGLWTAIIAGNAAPVATILREVAADLEVIVDRLSDTTTMPGMPIAPGTAAAISNVIRQGNLGVSRIPGKHGSEPRRWAMLEVLVPDEPGELGRLFTDLGTAAINIEDLTLDHSAGQPVGLARIMVDPTRVEEAAAALEARSWRIARKETR